MYSLLVWLLSLSIIILRFFHAVVSVVHSLLLSGIPLYEYTPVHLSVHSLIDIWGFFCSVFAIKNKATVNVEHYV